MEPDNRQQPRRTKDWCTPPIVGAMYLAWPCILSRSRNAPSSSTPFPEGCAVRYSAPALAAPQSLHVHSRTRRRDSSGVDRRRLLCTGRHQSRPSQGTTPPACCAHVCAATRRPAHLSTSCRPPRTRDGRSNTSGRSHMDTNTLLIIVVVVVLLGGGGFFWRGRR